MLWTVKTNPVLAELLTTSMSNVKTIPIFSILHRLWAIKQYGEDCSQHFWNPSCDTAGFGLYDAVQFKVSSDEEGQYRWCSSPRGSFLGNYCDDSLPKR